MIVYELRFYRRIMDGWDFVDNRLFFNDIKAKKILKLSGYRLIDGEDNIYSKSDSRVILIEKEVEE